MIKNRFNKLILKYFIYCLIIFSSSTVYSKECNSSLDEQTLNNIGYDKYYEDDLDQTSLEIIKIMEENN